MTAADIHAAKLLVEGGLVAAFLVFLWIVAPYIRNPPRR